MLLLLDNRTGSFKKFLTNSELKRYVFNKIPVGDYEFYEVVTSSSVINLHVW